MNDIVAWVVTALVVGLIVAFILSIVSLRAVPTSERPRTRTLNRFGEVIGSIENPDYHVGPGADLVPDPAVDLAQRTHTEALPPSSDPPASSPANDALEEHREPRAIG